MTSLGTSSQSLGCRTSNFFYTDKKYPPHTSISGIFRGIFVAAPNWEHRLLKAFFYLFFVYIFSMTLVHSHSHCVIIHGFNKGRKQIAASIGHYVCTTLWAGDSSIAHNFISWVGARARLGDL